MTWKNLLPQVRNAIWCSGNGALPFLSAGAEQPLGSRGRRGSGTVYHAEDGIHGLLSPSCHLGLGVSTVPHADGTTAGHRVRMNARVTLQAGGVSAARSRVESFCLTSPSSMLHLAHRLLGFCLNT